MLVRTLYSVAVTLLCSLPFGCRSVSAPPAADVSVFAAGVQRTDVERVIGSARKEKRLGNGQSLATYEVILMPAHARAPRALSLDALRPDGSGQTGLALMVHKDGRAGMGPNDIATAAANMAAEYLWNRISDTTPPAKDDRARKSDYVRGRRCRVEAVYDAHGRLLSRRIAPLEEPPATVTRWEDVAAPVGTDSVR